MKKLLSLVLCGLMIGSVITPVSATYKADKNEETNWKQEGNSWYVLNDEGEKMTGWYRDAKLCWYYLDYSTGAMKTGWGADGKDANGNVIWYYFGDNGIMKTGWQSIGSQLYYFYDSGEKAGSMARGTVEIDGLMYYFSSDGILIGQSNKGEPIISPYAPVAELVDEILDEIIQPGMSEREELKAIHDWICNNISYGFRDGSYQLKKGSRTDGKEDLVNMAYKNRSFDFYNSVFQALKGGRGVCDEYAYIFCTLADALGYKTTNTGGQYKGRGHMVSLIWFDNEWLIVDVQADDYHDDGTISYGGFLVKHDRYTNFESQAQYWLDWYNYSDPLMQSLQNDWNRGYLTQFDSVQEAYDFYTGANN